MSGRHPIGDSPGQGTQVESVVVHSAGLRLAADIYRPTQSVDRLPTVVLCHGYSGFRRLFLPEYAETLCAAGFGVLAFDYRGWGDSDGRPHRLAPCGRVEDAQAAVSYVEGRDWVDPDRIGMLGISFGGGTAIHVAAIDRRVKAVVSVGGVGDGERWMQSVRSTSEMEQLEERSREHRRRLADGAGDEMVSRFEVLIADASSRAIDAGKRTDDRYIVSELPMEYVWETLEFKPERLARYIAPTPLLLITGAVDRVVPPDESRAIYAEAREPKRLVVIPGLGHYDAYLPEGRASVFAEAIPWFRRYLL